MRRILILVTFFCFSGSIWAQTVYCVVSTKTYHYNRKCSFCEKPYEVMSVSKAIENGYHECGVCEPGLKKNYKKNDRPSKKLNTSCISTNEKAGTSKKKESGTVSSSGKRSTENGDNKPRRTDVKAKNKKR